MWREVSLVLWLISTERSKYLLNFAITHCGDLKFNSFTKTLELFIIFWVLYGADVLNKPMMIPGRMTEDKLTKWVVKLIKILLGIVSWPTIRNPMFPAQHHFRTSKKVSCIHRLPKPSNVTHMFTLEQLIWVLLSTDVQDWLIPGQL